jgi:hypothetical protein
LEKQKEIIKNSLAQELEKLNVSKKNMLINIKNSIQDNLKLVDETFSITNENKNTNKKFRDYLSAKNIKLKNQIKRQFPNLNFGVKNFDQMTDEEKTIFIEDIINYDELLIKAINASIDNVYFSKNKINSLYKAFLNYSNNLA